MTEAARARVGSFSVRNDVRHRRVIAGEPVRRTESVGDLLPRERQRAARNLLLRCIWRRGGGSGGRRDGDGVRPGRWFARRTQLTDRDAGHERKDDERQDLTHVEPPGSRCWRNYTSKVRLKPDTTY